VRLGQDPRPHPGVQRRSDHDGSLGANEWRQRPETLYRRELSGRPGVNQLHLPGQCGEYPTLCSWGFRQRHYPYSLTEESALLQQTCSSKITWAFVAVWPVPGLAAQAIRALLQRKFQPGRDCDDTSTEDADEPISRDDMRRRQSGPA
jgi:hypothetical protein